MLRSQGTPHVELQEFTSHTEMARLGNRLRGPSGLPGAFNSAVTSRLSFQKTLVALSTLLGLSILCPSSAWGLDPMASPGHTTSAWAQAIQPHLINVLRDIWEGTPLSWGAHGTPGQSAPASPNRKPRQGSTARQDCAGSSCGAGGRQQPGRQGQPGWPGESSSGEERREEWGIQGRRRVLVSDQEWRYRQAKKRMQRRAGDSCWSKHEQGLFYKVLLYAYCL